jgi:tetrahydromethanopterin S-methyltransferase subunit F
MPRFDAIWKMMQYLPLVLEVSRSMRHKEQDTDNVMQLHQEMTDGQQRLQDRTDNIEQEQALLRTRVREVESSLNTLQVITLTVGVLLAVLVIILLIVVVSNR